MICGKRTVLLFEDDPKQRPKIAKAIREALKPTFKLDVFEGGDVKKGSRGQESYEDSLRGWLFPRKDVALIVCDRDLSRIDDFTGLSEIVVSKVASDLGIPVCLYARGTFGEGLLERQREWGEGRIVLRNDPIDIGAEEVALLADGFLKMEQGVREATHSRCKRAPHTPAGVLAHVLGRSGMSEMLAAFGSGDKSMLSDVLPVKRRSTGNQMPQLAVKMPALLGYWLYNSVMRFPGVLVNEVAAESHLNIRVGSLADEHIRDLFKKAIYLGPFSSEREPLWWRPDLDEIVDGADCRDGKELVKKKLGREVRFCPCSLDQSKPAGYYCMVSRKPVSFDNSYGNIAWFPQGADLARVGKEIYKEMGPWLGLY